MCCLCVGYFTYYMVLSLQVLGSVGGRLKSLDLTSSTYLGWVGLVLTMYFVRHNDYSLLCTVFLNVLCIINCVPCTGYIKHCKVNSVLQSNNIVLCIVYCRQFVVLCVECNVCCLLIIVQYAECTVYAEYFFAFFVWNYVYSVNFNVHTM